MPERRSDLMIFRSRNGLRYEALLLHREKAVAVDAYNDRAALHRGESRPEPAPAAAEIVAVD